MSDISESSSISMDSSLKIDGDEMENAMSSHPMAMKLLEELNFLRVHQSPLEFAYYLHGINDYLRDVILRKENKIKRRALNDTCMSEAFSMANFNYPVLQEPSNSMYKSFPDRSKNNSIAFLGNNSTVSNFGRNFQNQRVNNQFPPVGKFSEMEDTYGTLNINGESSSANPTNTSRFDHTNSRTNFSAPLKTTPIYSSLFEKSKQNVSTFRTHNSTISTSFAEGNNQNRSLIQQNGATNEVDERFNCVRAGPLGKKFNLAPIQEDQDESDDDQTAAVASNIQEVETFSSEGSPKVGSSSSEGCPKVGSSSSKGSPKEKENSILPDCIVLTNWTVLIQNGALLLKGSKIIRNKIIEQNHTSAIVTNRLKDGKIKTKDNSVYFLKDTFINKNVPKDIQHFFRNHKFPLHWRKMLSLWMKIETEKVQKKNELKSCTVVLERSAPKSKEVEANSESNKKKKNKQQTPDTGGKKPKLKKTTNWKNSSKEAASSKSKKVASKATTNKLKSNNENQEKALSKPGTSGEQHKNVFEDMFGDAMGVQNVYTPTALMRSIKKNQVFLGHHTPPAGIISEHLNKNKVNHKTKETGEESFVIKCKDNLIAKRMAKLKKTKNVNNKKNKKESSPENNDIQNIMAALTNKTPLSTPKLVKDVFRKKEKDETMDSSFGSDVSSISS